MQSQDDIKAEQRMLKHKAFLPTAFGGIVTIAIFAVLIWTSHEKKTLWINMMLGLSAVFSVLGATTTYFSAKGRRQETFAAVLAIVISISLLLFFPDESKTVPFFAAAKQFGMVLYAGAVALLCEENLAKWDWQKAHPKATVGIVLVPLALPFIAEGGKWPYREGLNDICAIFVAATFGMLYIKQREIKVRKKTIASQTKNAQL